MIYEEVQLRSKTSDLFKKLLIEHPIRVAFSVDCHFKDWRLPECYTNTHPTSKRTQSVFVATKNRLILYREMIGTPCGKPAKRVRTLCGQRQIHILLLFLIIIIIIIIIAVIPDERFLRFSSHTKDQQVSMDISPNNCFGITLRMKV